jgi:hypothetical protein
MLFLVMRVWIIDILFATFRIIRRSLKLVLEAMITRRAEHCGSEFWGTVCNQRLAAADMVMDLGESLYVLMVLCCIL